MKKLMFAATALAAGIACAEITSANIVGYVDRPLSAFSFTGFVMPQIAGEGEDGEAFTYGDLQVNCGATEETSETGWQALADSLVELDETGSYVKDLVYVPAWLAGDLDVETTGWYVNDVFEEGADLNGYPLDFGSAVQMCVLDEVGAKITYAGEVKQAPTVTDLVGFMSVANCSPKTIYGKDIIVNCGETEETSETGWQALADSIVILDETGSYVKDLVYVPAWLAGDLGVETTGWYENDVFEEGSDYNNSDELCLEPGQGFQVCVLDDLGATVTIKSALAK